MCLLCQESYSGSMAQSFSVSRSQSYGLHMVDTISLGTIRIVVMTMTIVCDPTAFEVQVCV